MSTWDSMSDVDRGHLRDAGRDKAGHHLGSRPAVRRPVRRSTPSPTPCPRCGALMRDRRRYGDTDGRWTVEYVDRVCLTCGWLDEDVEGGV